MSAVFETGVAIVGGGHAGTQVAIALRDGGYAGRITIVGAEPDLPYDRPALSKGYLSGHLTSDRTLLRNPEYWNKRDIKILQPIRAVGVVADTHHLQLDEGSVLRYDKLVWAAGGSPRRLDCRGHDLPGVHYLRTRADADRIKSGLADVRRVAVIGGGYLGLEVAAVMTELGKQVVVLEAQERILARVTGSVVSAFCEDEHRRRGVDIRTSVQVTGLYEANGRVAGVELSTGERVAVDQVIVGIGIVPNVEPLLALGAEGGNGVLVDGQCRTTLDDVYAVGDCALQLNRFAGDAAVRLESIPNANGQANVVAHDILGRVTAHDAVPWFWSAQFDIKLQTVGIVAGHDDYYTCGNRESDSFAVVYMRNGVVVAVDCINSTKSFIEGRKLIGSPLQATELVDFPQTLPGISALAV